ncbi:MAG: 50S ribosomal protein L15 [Candidatus Omnitrophica bacterium]|nr:50S ribosomal protein L15 [Candidatus Omnitrophota bacterium]
MKVHELKSNSGARRSSIRRGRGRASGKGVRCGKGQTGQNSRAGHGHKLWMGGGEVSLIRRVPRFGFNHVPKVAYQIVNTGQLQSLDEGINEITPEILLENRVIRKASLPVKLLAEGELKRKVKISVHKASVAAREKVQAAGGTVELLEL